MNLPKFVTKQLATHNFNERTTAYVSRFGQNIKPRQFVAAPISMYLNGPDMFGERHIEVEEKDVMTGTVIRTWTAIVGNGKCYEI